MAMELEYRGKHVLAPMVRVGGLPLRMLAAAYGADITYGEEIVDHKMVRCKRVLNETLGTVDFVETSNTIYKEVVFRTCEAEKHRVVFQVGTADAVRCLKVATMVAGDVAAFDVNMGCPKSFSTSGGMGAALLGKPELIHDILTTLKRNLNIPVTCKIRLLKTYGETVELARRIEKTGVSALAVHGRRVADRTHRDPAQWDGIEEVASALSIPIIANGDVFEYSDFQRVKDATGASSVMVARGAMWNASVFRPEGTLFWEDVKKEYVRKCIEWDHDVKWTKHTLKEMIMHHSCLEFAEGKALNRCRTLVDVADMASSGQLSFDWDIILRNSSASWKIAFVTNQWHMVLQGISLERGAVFFWLVKVNICNHFSCTRLEVKLFKTGLKGFMWFKLLAASGLNVYFRPSVRQESLCYSKIFSWTSKVVHISTALRDI